MRAVSVRFDVAEPIIARRHVDSSLEGAPGVRGIRKTALGAKRSDRRPRLRRLAQQRPEQVCTKLKHVALEGRVAVGKDAMKGFVPTHRTRPQSHQQGGSWRCWQRGRRRTAQTGSTARADAGRSSPCARAPIDGRRCPLRCAHGPLVHRSGCEQRPSSRGRPWPEPGSVLRRIFRRRETRTTASRQARWRPALRSAAPCHRADLHARRGLWHPLEAL